MKGILQNKRKRQIMLTIPCFVAFFEHDERVSEVVGDIRHVLGYEGIVITEPRLKPKAAAEFVHHLNLLGRGENAL